MIVLRSIKSKFPDMIKINKDIYLEKTQETKIAKLIGNLSDKIKRSQDVTLYYEISDGKSSLGLISLEFSTNNELVLSPLFKFNNPKLELDIMSVLLSEIKSKDFKIIRTEDLEDSTDIKVFKSLGFIEEYDKNGNITGQYLKVL